MHPTRSDWPPLVRPVPYIGGGMETDCRRPSACPVNIMDAVTNAEQTGISPE